MLTQNSEDKPESSLLLPPSLSM